MSTWALPPDLGGGEQEVATWMRALSPVDPPPRLDGRLPNVVAPRPRSYAWVGVAAAAILLAFGLSAFSRVAAVVAEAGCSGALCAEPIVAVVDDPQVPLYQSLEALAAFDGEAGCWDALADLGGPR